MSNKCKICTKSVYPVDPQLNLDGALFHKSCAKCFDCNCQITISNFSKTETPEHPYLLLCKTHYFTRFNTSGGSYVGGEKFKSSSSEKYTGASTFAGVHVPSPTAATTASQQSNTVSPAARRTSINVASNSASKCKTCGLTVYPMDAQINLDGSLFHKACAKCADCQSQITIANFVKNESSDQTTLLCKTHYLERFASQGGAYGGGEKFKVKNARDLNADTLAALAASPVRAGSANGTASPAVTKTEPVVEEKPPAVTTTVFQKVETVEVPASEQETPVFATGGGGAVEILDSKPEGLESAYAEE